MLRAVGTFMPLAVAALLGAAELAAQPAPADPALRAELLRLGREDQEARDGFGPAAARNDTAYLRRLMAGDSARTRRLREIVRRHGWPGRRLVGADGAKAAWLILQHTDGVSFQREMLPTLWALADSGEVARSEVAMLNDRVLVREGRPQRYGSSFSLKDGRLVADPIEDLAGLDARRAAVGLPAMTEYARKLGEVYRLPVVWPPTP